MIVGEYKQRVVYKRHNAVGNGPAIVLETFGEIYHVNTMACFLWP